MIRVGVVGATGYAGSELVRWLLAHPGVELARVVSRSQAGRPVGEAVPALLGLTDLVLTDFDAAALAGLDAVLLATPHGTARPLVAALEAAGAARILDLSADHRHAPGWVYGQPEWRREALVGARRVAVPGCFATAITLAVAPFVAAAAVAGPVQVVAATGSTGAGVSPGRATHHPERFANLKAYKVLTHQHVPEVQAALGLLGAPPRLRFVPLSAPLDRGILATCFIPVRPGLDVQATVARAYAEAPFVRLRQVTPEVRLVRGTAFCDLAVHRDEDCAVVLSALDNLGKGAAAQAVQCLDLVFDLPARPGLGALPCTP